MRRNYIAKTPRLVPKKKLINRSRVNIRTFDHSENLLQRWNRITVNVEVVREM